MERQGGYERSAHLYDLFDTKETRLVFEVYEAGELVERVKERSLVGITTRHTVHDLLRRTGFQIRREWGDYDFTPYEAGDALLIVEAIKRREI